MNLPLERLSPSGPPVAFSATSDDVANVSTVPGASVTAALNALYGRSVRYLDQQDAPIALWNFNNTLAAVVGPTLSTTSGTFAFTDVYPGVRGIWLNPGALLSAALTPGLVLLGAMSVEVLLQMQVGPPQPWLCGVGGPLASAAQANNVSWSFGLAQGATIPFNQGSLWEHGAGVAVNFATPTASGSPSFPFIHQVTSVGMARSSNGSVQFYFDGEPFSTPSGALTLPDGGGSGIFTVGAQNGDVTPSQPMYLSIAVYDRTRPASEWKASYNRSIGFGLGFVS